MNVHELVVEMKLLERRLTLYEEKYGILSQDFYDALMSNQLERYDEYDETRTDFSRWKGIYETWQRRKHVPPNIKRNRIPAPGISFTTPNLPQIIRELEELTGDNDS